MAWERKRMKSRSDLFQKVEIWPCSTEAHASVDRPLCEMQALANKSEKQ